MADFAGWFLGMRCRLSLYGLLFAWLCASGSLLDVAQGFAWLRMCAGYTQTMPLTVALHRTFDPEKPCEICTAVLNARKAAEAGHQPAEKALIEKMTLIAASAEPELTPPVFEVWPALVNLFAEARSYPVPVPPPRCGAVC
ncbi:MAG: hypothetical protein JF599_08580 [Verrucomicrobia bacterium]|nr:hypothetical protein [Verrucomicrobiota bacterium]